MARLFLFILLLVPATASAQDRLLKGLTPEGMPTVFLTDDRGVETRGRLVKLGDESVILLVDGQSRRFEMTRVSRIDRKGDSLRNGAIGGAVFGLCLGLVGSLMADCSGDCPGFRVAGVIFSTAFYSAAGTGLDALVQGRTELYRARPAPVATAGKRAAVGFTIGW